MYCLLILRGFSSNHHFFPRKKRPSTVISLTFFPSAPGYPAHERMTRTSLHFFSSVSRWDFFFERKEKTADFFGPKRHDLGLLKDSEKMCCLVLEVVFNLFFQEMGLNLWEVLTTIEHLLLFLGGGAKDCRAKRNGLNIRIMIHIDINIFHIQYGFILSVYVDTMLY